MKLQTIKCLGLGAAVAAGLTTSANAVVVPYSTTAATSVGVGSVDTVSLSGFSGSVNLTPGVPQLGVELNDITWNYYPGETAIGGTGSISTTMAVTLAVGQNQTITDNLQVSVLVNKGVQFGQTLSVSSTSILDFTWNSGAYYYDLTMIPQAASFSEVGTTAGSIGGNLYGEFVLSATPVPEPSTVMAGLLVLLPTGASTLQILRKKRAA